MSSWAYTSEYDLKIELEPNTKSTLVAVNFVFFHATGFNAQTYEILLRKLADISESKFNLYALDQRGHGFSKARAEPLELNSWSVFLDDGLDFIDSLSGKIICSGH